MPLTPGQILNNRYRITGLLGQGGFGAVYKAWDNNLEAHRAIKENLDISAEGRRQFKLEAQILDKLIHPNLPRVIDHFINPGRGQYLVMDFVEGEDLGAMLKTNGGSLEETLVVKYAEDVCDALAYLHAQIPPIIHRDVKPANIRITPQGRAMLVDFGIAKVYDTERRTTLGARAVTPGYSPNEQYVSSGLTDARTDIYALGATLYTLLTGQVPPEAPERNLGAALPKPAALNSTLSPRIDAAITKAMEPLPERRFGSVAEFKATLGDKVAVRIVGNTEGNRGKATKTIASTVKIHHPRTIPWEILIISVASLLLLVVAGFLLFGFWESPNSPTGIPAISSARTITPRATSTWVPFTPTYTSTYVNTLPASPTSSQTSTPVVFPDTVSQTQQPTPVGIILFEDDFENPAITFAKWGITPGWDVVNGKYRATTNQVSIIGDESWADFIVYVDIMGMELIDKIMNFRKTETAWYGVDFRSDPYNDVVLVKTLPGRANFILTSAKATNFNNAWYTMMLVARQNAIEIYINGRPYIIYTDTEAPISSGRIELGGMMSGKPNSAVYFDNFKVIQADAP